jgi:hypothetical protein
MDPVTGGPPTLDAPRPKPIVTASGVTRRRLVRLLLFAACSAAPVRAEAANDLEDRVKAAFLLNFTKFVEWPAETAKRQTPITICVFGDDRFVSTLERMVEGESIASRRIVAQAARPQAAGHCTVAFIRRSEKDLAGVLASFGQGVLTVGESEDFLAKGGMIAFVLENRRVRFDVSQTAVRNAGLRLSSRLLSVARSVG